MLDSFVSFVVFFFLHTYVYVFVAPRGVVRNKHYPRIRTVKPFKIVSPPSIIASSRPYRKYVHCIFVRVRLSLFSYEYFTVLFSKITITYHLNKSVPLFFENNLSVCKLAVMSFNGGARGNARSSVPNSNLYY